MQLTVAMNGWHAQPIEAYQLVQRAGELQHIAPARSRNVGARMRQQPVIAGHNHQRHSRGGEQ